MALITEDGTGLATAESYTSVAAADQYHSERGNSAWALLTTAAKEQALRLATDYMVQTYRLRWAGYRVTAVQALDWPRYFVPIKDSPGGYGTLPAYYPYNTIPAAVASACADLALRASSGTALAADLDRPTIEESVGPITVKYAAGARQALVYRAVDNLLNPMLKLGGSASTVSRA